MALRWKASNPMTVVSASEMQHIADNGVVQVDTAADLDSPNLVNANMAYVLSEFSGYKRISAGVGAVHWAGMGVNSAKGGTESEFVGTDGKKYRQHVFTANGDFIVEKSEATKPFHVVLIGGGGHGGAGGFDGGGPHGGGQGGGGGLYDGPVVIPVGTNAVAVGAGGSHNNGGYQGQDGGDTVAFGFTAGGGGGGHWGQDAMIGRDGRPGVPSPQADGGHGHGSNHPVSDPSATARTTYALDATVGAGGWGGPAGANTQSGPGGGGIVIVRYEI